MRQGPEYTQFFEYDKDGRPIITVPLELVSDFDDCSLVRWTDNRDGSFKLTVFDTVPNV